MKFIHVDVDRAWRKYVRRVDKWHDRIIKQSRHAHEAHISWPPDKMARQRRMRTVKKRRR